ncbi:ABC branched amino acid transporter family, periplasmic substrate-binding subunit [Pseudooceanicola batsensis HTCC2597]|uniref:ABC branched amino acid transporter family, periplasmic substrate-binding subunit n=1 Tax=Pseudooceanicola batsensis (strain ATCC BAA-863 / DSM 15984 / KCTC 12145 / HTCC2597) TaxID=252305 RepID=A3TYH9_PSEBH|nr:ABC transporter substrate-binding protein [Pseudooceanicola batsensis]EAQ03213.1 ABC branched amino acid transporter family, periplasmic substrate-binding subunit [Pseudooceanicola batsensis HTCC2597]
MRLKLMAALAATVMGVAPALADLTIPALNYRTGPYAPSGIPYADGFSDYMTMLNERDGGIGGEQINVLECETGYNTEKGVECYEQTKGQGALVYIPQSTGITYQLIPKATADEIPIWSVAYGRTSAVNGKVFEWIFNLPGTYWDAASIMTKYAMEQEGGSLDGKKIALVYHNSAYGKEPIRTLEKLSEKHGFELVLLAVDHPGQEQKSQWLQIRRERPDYVFMWGWGVMNQVAIQEASNIRFPMDKFIGVWWSGSEADVVPVGEGADGYKSVTWHGAGTDYPAMQEIKSTVIDAGLAAGDGTKFGEVGYNRGVYTAAVLAEAIRQAQEASGTSDIDATQLRDAMETLEISDARFEELGLPGFTGGFQLSCAQHSAPRTAFIQQWNAADQTWTPVSDFMEPDLEVIDPLIMEDSMAYAEENGITPRECD